MDAQYDLVIRNGSILDGSGKDAFMGDVAIAEGRIGAVGVVEGRGRAEIDAAGLTVTPGFIDIHTHYDGHVTWEERSVPSGEHGVTTVVTGNCGVGFAPVRAPDRDRLVSLMAGVEDIPEVVMTEGLRWNWESFPEYMDAVAEQRHDVDVAVMLPHAALRLFVMGNRAVVREPATEADIAEMRKLTREAIRAGAIGVGTSRALQHKAITGESVSTARVGCDELIGIAKGMSDEGRGVFQLLNDFQEGQAIEEEFALMRDIAAESGRPLSYTLHQKAADPEGWRDMLRKTQQANDDGITMRAQVIGRPTGVLVGFELTVHPFVGCPSYQPIAKLPFAERIAALRDPALRAKLVKEEPIDMSQVGIAVGRAFKRMFELGTPPNYEPDPETSIAKRAKAAGVSPAELAYDLMLEEDGHAILFLAAQDYEYGDLEVTRAMLEDPNSLLGLGDGGAHCGVICDASFPTHMLAFWARDRKRGPTLPLPWVVNALTAQAAAAIGLTDRGTIAPGQIADINIIDVDRIQLGQPEVRYDLPAGGRRIVQGATGYVATIKSGVVTYRNGEPSGAMPGKLLRAHELAAAA